MEDSEDYVSVGRKQKYDWDSLKHVGDALKFPDMTPKEANSMRASASAHGVKLSCRGLRSGGYQVVVKGLIR